MFFADGAASAMDHHSDRCATAQPAREFPTPNEHGVFTCDDLFERIAFKTKKVSVCLNLLQVGPDEWASGYWYDIAHGGGGSGVWRHKEAKTRDECIADGITLLCRHLAPVAAGAAKGYGYSDDVRRQCRRAIEALLCQVPESLWQVIVARVIEKAKHG